MQLTFQNNISICMGFSGEIWRNISKVLDTYIVTSVSFGDKLSAKIKEKEYPQAANIVLNNTYVDGIVNSVKD